MTQVVLSIPSDEFKFFSVLANKMGWTFEKTESLLDKFIRSCDTEYEISDEDIQKEVNAVREPR